MPPQKKKKHVPTALERFRALVSRLFSKPKGETALRLKIKRIRQKQDQAE